MDIESDKNDFQKTFRRHKNNKTETWNPIYIASHKVNFKTITHQSLPSCIESCFYLTWHWLNSLCAHKRTTSEPLSCRRIVFMYPETLPIHKILISHDSHLRDHDPDDRSSGKTLPRKKIVSRRSIQLGLIKIPFSQGLALMRLHKLRG